MRGKLEAGTRKLCCPPLGTKQSGGPPSPSLDNEGRGRCGARLLSGGQSERLESDSTPAFSGWMSPFIFTLPPQLTHHPVPSCWLLGGVCRSKGGVWECVGMPWHIRNLPVMTRLPWIASCSSPKTAKVLGHGFRALATDQVAQLETPWKPAKATFHAPHNAPSVEASMQPRAGILNHTPLVSLTPVGTSAGHPCRAPSRLRYGADFCSGG
jgi:hypothetical protein